MITLTITLMLFTLTLKAPNDNALVVVSGEEIQPYKDLIFAIGSVECDFDTLAYNPEEKATGFFQIRPIRIEHFNKLTGKAYQLDDMFDYYKAEEVFLYFADRIGPYDLEKIAKNWNGSGPMTIDYWKRVKLKLNTI